MSLPENPESRLEQYLQNIALGEGTYPSNPDSRLEQYLAYIAENADHNRHYIRRTGVYKCPLTEDE